MEPTGRGRQKSNLNIPPKVSDVTISSGSTKQRNCSICTSTVLLTDQSLGYHTPPAWDTHSPRKRFPRRPYCRMYWPNPKFLRMGHKVRYSGFRKHCFTGGVARWCRGQGAVWLAAAGPSWIQRARREKEVSGCWEHFIPQAAFLSC